MPNRADYTNALMQAVAQQELARRQSPTASTTNPLVNQMAIQGPPPPMPGVGGSPYPQELAPPLSQMLVSVDPTSNEGAFPDPGPDPFRYVEKGVEELTQELGHISNEQVERMKGFSRATGGGAFPELGSEMPLQVNKKGEDYNPNRQWKTQSLIALFPEVDPRVFYEMSDEELRMFYSKQLHLQRMRQQSSPPRVQTLERYTLPGEE